MAATFPVAKLEITFPYTCGGRVAVEFDARLSIGHEDGVLIVGEVEFYGYDDDHDGAYEICNDQALAEKIRTYLFASVPETTRAHEALNLNTTSLSTTNFSAINTPNQHSGRAFSRTNPGSPFEDFVGAYRDCTS